jgi:hypothetical protein
MTDLTRAELEMFQVEMSAHQEDEMQMPEDAVIFRNVDIGSGWTAEIVRTTKGQQVTLRNALRVSPIQLSESMTERLLRALAL